jgi:hypothetical protein
MTKKPTRKSLEALKRHFDKTHVGPAKKAMTINAFNASIKLTDKMAKAEAEKHRRNRKEKQEAAKEETKSEE